MPADSLTTRKSATPTKRDATRDAKRDATRRGPPLAWVGWAFLILLGLVTVYYIVSKAWSNPTLLVQNILDGLKLGFVYALIALGYTMVYGIVKLINFAHGDVFMVGAFTSFYAVSRFNLHLWPQAAFPAMDPTLSLVIGSLTVVLLSMAVCVILAVTIERVAYKPLRDAPRIAALITAIGVSFFLEYLRRPALRLLGALYPLQGPLPHDGLVHPGRDSSHRLGDCFPRQHDLLFQYIPHHRRGLHPRADLPAIHRQAHEDRRGYAGRLLR